MKHGSLLILFLNPARIIFYLFISIGAPRAGLILLVIEFALRLYNYFSVQYKQTADRLIVYTGVFFRRRKSFDLNQVLVTTRFSNPIFQLFSVSALKISYKKHGFSPALVIPFKPQKQPLLYKARFFDFFIWGILEARTFYLFLNSSLFISLAAQILSVLSGYENILDFLEDTLLKNRSVAHGIAILSLFFVLLYLLSAAIYVFIRFYNLFGFSFYKAENAYTAEYGLIDRRIIRYDSRAFCGLILRENPLMRLFGRCTLEMLSFDGSLTFPVIKKKIALDFAKSLFFTENTIQFRSPKRARRYFIRGAKVLTALFTTLFFAILGAFGLMAVSLFVFILLWIDGALKYKANHIHISKSALSVIRGGIVRQTAFLFWDKIFSAGSVSFFTHQKRNICTITIKPAAILKTRKIKAAGFSKNCLECINQNFTSHTKSERKR